MIIKKYYFAALMLATALSIAAISDTDALTALVSRIKVLSEAQRQEKVYLHLDKPYYTAGDNIWFKAYVLDEQELKPATKSDVLYVELINDNLAVQTLKLPLEEGTAWGDFHLPDTLSEGNYRVRAYTRWMRNAGEKFFFDRTIAIGNGLTNDVFVSSDFEFDKKGDAAEVVALVSFKDKSGNPWAGRKVNVRTNNTGKSNHLVKTETDAEGRIRLSLPPTTTATAGTTSISATINLEPKQEITKVIPVPGNPNIFDVEFFPEGGKIIKGVPTRIAVKAINANLHGVPVSGALNDEHGGNITFSTSSTGLGSFVVNAGSTLPQKVQIRFGNGTQRTFQLPKIEESGYSLAVSNTSPGTKTIRMTISPDLLGKGNLSLIGQRNGNVFFASKVQENKQVISMNIPTANLPSGILQLTLLAGKEPVAERFTFVYNQRDNQAIAIEGLKSVYAKRSPVELDIDAVPGSYSVSVTHTALVNPDPDSEGNILSAFLLTSDMEDRVEKPNRYISGDGVAEAELLLMTQRARSIPWATILGTQMPEIVFPVQKKIVVSGTVRSKGAPVVNGEVTMMKSPGKLDAVKTLTDSKGRFKFDSLEFADSAKILIQARTREGKRELDITIDKFRGQKITINKNLPDEVANISDQLKTYVTQSNNFFKEQLSKGLFETSAIQIEEVVINSERNVSKEVTHGFVRMHGQADQVFTAKDLDSVSFLTSFFTSKIRGDYKDYEVLIDGLRLRELEGGWAVDFFGQPDIGRYIQGLDPASIEKIEVLSSAHLKSAYKAGPLRKSIILITTKRNNDYTRVAYAPGMASFMVTGFSPVRKFNSPDHEANRDDRPDLRSTVYWNPVIATDENDVLKLKYFNTDMPGKYRIIIEGIGENKGISRKEIIYEVKEGI